MRTIVSCLIVLTALACAEERPEPGSPEPVSPEPPLRPAQPRPELITRARPCDGAPAWTGLAERCEAEGYVYGVAEAQKIPNPSMRVHIAADRARAALAETGTTLLENSEVLDLASCEETTWALARRPRSDTEDALPACGEAIAARSAPGDGCPEWSTALATVDGDRIRGVGWVAGISNPAMAGRAASNRAIAEQRKSLGLQVTRLDDGSVSTATTSQAMTVQEEAVVESCGEFTVARVISRIAR